MPSKAAQAWLDKAEEDEAVINLIVGAGGPWSMAAYHVQQAAEKYIKAVLVESGIAPPKSHDLTHLSGLLKKSPPLDVLNAAAMTSAYAWLTRYPGAPPFDEPQVRQAIADLSVISAWASKELQ
jgi:HEPN domain-containing protein